MKRNRKRRLWTTRRLAVLIAAAPLFQFSQCATGSRQVLANVVNNLPATFNGILESILLFPLQLLLSGGTNITQV